MRVGIVWASTNKKELRQFLDLERDFVYNERQCTQVLRCLLMPQFSNRGFGRAKGGVRWRLPYHLSILRVVQNFRSYNLTINYIKHQWDHVLAFLMMMGAMLQGGRRGRLSTRCCAPRQSWVPETPDPEGKLSGKLRRLTLRGHRIIPSSGE